MGNSSAGNRVIVYLEVDPNNAGQNALKQLRVDVEQFAQVASASSASAGHSFGSYLERFAIRQIMLTATRDVEQFFASSIKLAQEAYKAEEQFNGAILATGQSYAVAAKAARDYRNLYKSTTAQADEGTAATAQIANRAGLTSASDVRIQKAVADIIAAQGGGAVETTKALEKLASGNGEIVERLTGKSAAEAERTFALLHDKLPQDLLPFEKALSHVNAIIQQSKLFNGEAAAHLDTVSGRIEQSTNKWEEFKTGIGEAILSSAQLRDILESLVGVTNELSGAATRGFGSVEEAGKRAEDSLSNGNLLGALKSIWNHVELGAKTGIVTTGSIFSGDVFTERGRAGLALADQYRDDILNRDRINAEELQAATNREIRNRQVRELKQAGISQPDISSIFQQASKYQGQAQENFIEDQVAAIKKVYETKAAAREKDAQQEEQNQQRQLQQAKEFASQQIAALKYVSDLGARLHADNPYVKLFENAETVADRMREKFKLLGSDIIKQITSAEQKAIELETYSQHLKTSLSAVQLEFQADSLQKGLVGISAEQQRQLDVLQKRFEAATQAPALRREAEAYRNGFLPQNPYAVRQDEMRDYENVKRLRPTGSDEAARTGQKLIDDYILQQTKNLPINARFSPDFFTRELGQDRAAALDASAKRLQANIQDEIKRAEAGRAGVQLANRELQELAKHPPGSGAERDAFRGQFLAVTDKLNPNELTGALRQAVILASREEAQHQRQLEKEAQDFRKELVGSGGILHQIKDAIERKPTDKSSLAQLSKVVPGLSAFAATENIDVLRIPTKPAYNSKEAYEAAHAATLEKMQREAATNYFTNPNAVGYDPSLNRIAFGGDTGEQDEKLNALMRRGVSLATPLRSLPQARRAGRMKSINTRKHFSAHVRATLPRMARASLTPRILTTKRSFTPDILIRFAVLLTRKTTQTL